MYVSYPPNAPKDMGPPSIGAAPPMLQTGTMFERYTSSMTPVQVEQWRACVRAKVAAAGDGKTRVEYYDQCRNQVFGVEQATTLAPAPSGGGLLSTLPSWAIYAGAGVGVFVVVRLLTR